MGKLPDAPGITRITAQAHRPDSEAFRRWFKDSVVVDANGEPLVVWHGQSETDDPFPVFDFDRALDVGMHFGTEQAAEEVIDYAKPSKKKKLIRPFYLSIQNPLLMQDPTTWVSVPITGDVQQAVLQQLEDMGIITADENLEAHSLISSWFRGPEAKFVPLKEIERIAGRISKIVRKMLADRGYDGIVYQNEEEDKGSFSWIVFYPEQIKLADGTNTTFDPADPDIRRNPGDDDEDAGNEGNGPRAVFAVKTNFPEADLWVVRRGTPEKVGSVTKNFNATHVGVKVLATDLILPDYLYYVLMHIHSQGFFRPRMQGMLRLQHITTDDVKDALRLLSFQG